jgi:hypothetical protein
VVVLNLIVTPALMAGVGNATTAKALRQALATFASVPFETVVVAGVYNPRSKALARYNTYSAVNYNGNSQKKAPEIEGVLAGLDVPSFSSTPTLGPALQGGGALERLLQQEQQPPSPYPRAAPSDEAPLSLASLNTSLVYSTPFTILVVFNILGLVLGTTNDTHVWGIARRIAGEWGRSPTSLPSLAYPALVALGVNYSSSIGVPYTTLPSLTLELSTITVVLLPRVHVYAPGAGGVLVVAAGGVGGAAAGAAAAGSNPFSPAVISGIAMGALLLLLLLGLGLWSLWKRRKGAHKATSKVTPYVEEEEDVGEEEVVPEEEEEEEEEVGDGVRREDEEIKGLHSSSPSQEGSRRGENGLDVGDEDSPRGDDNDNVQREEGGGEEVVSGDALDAQTAATAAAAAPPPKGSLSSLLSRANALRMHGQEGLARLPPSALLAVSAFTRPPPKSQEEIERSAAERRERLDALKAQALEKKEKVKREEILALPVHQRILQTTLKKDKRKWWSAPQPKETRLDTTPWKPLEKEKKAILDAGGVWPPPDPMLALLKSGGGRIINGVIVKVVNAPPAAEGGAGGGARGGEEKL